MAPTQVRSVVLMQLQYLRLLLAVVATSVVLLVTNVSFMVRRNTRSPLLNGMLLAWILALIYGGACGMISAMRNRTAMAAHVVACWLIIAALHIWFILDSSHFGKLLPPSSNWSLIAQVFCDLLCVVFVAAMALLLRWHQFVLHDASVKLQALSAHTVVPVRSSQGGAVEVHVVV